MGRVRKRTGRTPRDALQYWGGHGRPSRLNQLGDGTPSTPGVVMGPDAQGNLSVSGFHTYSTGETLTRTVTVTDCVTNDQTVGAFTSAVANPVRPPTISKSFGSTSVSLGAQTSLAPTSPTTG